MRNKIISTFNEELNLKVLSIENVKKVSIVETAQGKYVFKIKTNPVELYREVLVRELLPPSFPIPKIIAMGDDFIVEDFIEGEIMHRANLNSDQKNHIYRARGQLLRAIHSVQMQGFGVVVEGGNGEADTLEKYVGDRFLQHFHKLEETGLLETSEIQKVADYIDHHGLYLQSLESVLLHMDYGEHNTLILDHHVAAVIDFELIASGPRAIDMTSLYGNHWHDGLFDALLQGYDCDLDLTEIQFYFVLASLWSIWWHQGQGNEELVESNLKGLMNVVGIN